MSVHTDHRAPAHLEKTAAWQARKEYAFVVPG